MATTFCDISAKQVQNCELTHKYIIVTIQGLEVAIPFHTIKEILRISNQTNLYDWGKSKPFSLQYQDKSIQLFNVSGLKQKNRELSRIVVLEYEDSWVGIIVDNVLEILNLNSLHISPSQKTYPTQLSWFTHEYVDDKNCFPVLNSQKLQQEIDVSLLNYIEEDSDSVSQGTDDLYSGKFIV